MKKKLYFEPLKNTPLEEYLTIEYGKIRDVHIVQLASEVPKIILEHDPTLNKDSYLPLKNFHALLKLKRIDKYISKQKNLKYTHEIILPSNEDLIKDVKLPQLPPSEYLLKMMIGNRQIFIKLNFIDLLLIDYSSFSWSNLNRSQKTTIIGSAIAIVVSISLFILR